MKVTARLLVIAAIFVTCLITANIIAVKLFSFHVPALGTVTLPAAIIIFPISYIFGDILTEVYGYRWARRIIWLGFLCNAIFVLFSWLGGLLPPAVFWAGNQPAYQTILGYTPRLLAASFAGYLVGEFANSAVLARLKVATRGRYLWVRTIGSTLIGQALDTVVFITLAFVATPAFSWSLVFYQWAGKVLIEALATPLTYRAVNYLKRREGVDVYDDRVNLNPFSL
jgi:queuosine precursor transporter